MWNAGLKFDVEIYPACESSKPDLSSIAAFSQTSLNVLPDVPTTESGFLAPLEPPAAFKSFAIRKFDSVPVFYRYSIYSSIFLFVI